MRLSLLCSTIFTILLCFGSEAVASPRIQVIGGEKIRREGVRPGSRRDTIAITNKGDEPLKLTAFSNCGCTLVSLDREEIAPGDTGRLMILSDLTGFDGSDWQKHISLGTNVPGRRSVPLEIRFAVLHDLRVSPAVTEMRRVPCPDGKCVWEVAIRNTSDTTMTLSPPVVDELRAAMVEFADGEKLRSAPTLLAPGDTLRLRILVTIIGGVTHPYTRVMIPTSSPFENEIWLGFYYVPVGVESRESGVEGRGGK